MKYNRALKGVGDAVGRMSTSPTVRPAKKATPSTVRLVKSRLCQLKCNRLQGYQASLRKERRVGRLVDFGIIINVQVQR